MSERRVTSEPRFRRRWSHAAGEHEGKDLGAPTWGTDWRVVDGALRAIAKRRAGLDADEARWLREAEVLEVWRPLGMVNALDYLERVLGYSPRVGQERLRVARRSASCRCSSARSRPASCRTARCAS